MPYEIPDHHQGIKVQKEGRPSTVEAADTGDWEADVPLNSSETWEQFKDEDNGQGSTNNTGNEAMPANEQ